MLIWKMLVTKVSLDLRLAYSLSQNRVFLEDLDTYLRPQGFVYKWQVHLHQQTRPSWAR